MRARPSSQVASYAAAVVSTLPVRSGGPGALFCAAAVQAPAGVHPAATANESAGAPVGYSGRVRTTQLLTGPR